MAAYQERYPRGTAVTIADHDALLEFQRTWKYHHPIEDKQLRHAGRVALVEEAGFYHGGDVLYALVGVPGTWHEDCLRQATSAEVASSPPQDPGLLAKLRRMLR